MDIGSVEWKEMIAEGAQRLGIDVQTGQLDQFAVHALALKEWNRKINLTAIDSPVDMAVKHFLDCIVSSRYIEPDGKLLDVGSGAGFPGIPLKVMMPSLNVTLVDATRKRNGKENLTLSSAGHFQACWILLKRACRCWRRKVC